MPALPLVIRSAAATMQPSVERFYRDFIDNHLTPRQPVRIAELLRTLAIAPATPEATRLLVRRGELSFEDFTLVNQGRLLNAPFLVLFNGQTIRISILFQDRISIQCSNSLDLSFLFASPLAITFLDKPQLDGQPAPFSDVLNLLEIRISSTCLAYRFNDRGLDQEVRFELDLTAGSRDSLKTAQDISATARLLLADEGNCCCERDPESEWHIWKSATTNNYCSLIKGTGMPNPGAVNLATFTSKQQAERALCAFLQRGICEETNVDLPSDWNCRPPQRGIVNTSPKLTDMAPPAPAARGNDVLTKEHCLVGALEFAPGLFEQVLSFKRSPFELKDVQLHLYGQPGSQSRTAPHDVRIYLNEHDITSDFIALLKEELSGQDQSALSSQFAKAMRCWLSTERALGYPIEDIRRDERLVEEALLLRPVLSSMTTLGNESAGSGGCLHPFTYLYREVKAPPISLQQIVHRFNARSPISLQFPTQDDWRLTISSGNCRLYSTDWRISGQNIKGRVHYSLTLVHVDSTLDMIQAVLEELRDTQEEIYRQLVPTGQLFEDVRRSQEALVAIVDLLDGFETLIGTGNDIRAVSMKLEEIKNLLRVQS